MNVIFSPTQSLLPFLSYLRHSIYSPLSSALSERSHEKYAKLRRDSLTAYQEKSSPPTSVPTSSAFTNHTVNDDGGLWSTVEPIPCSTFNAADSSPSSYVDVLIRSERDKMPLSAGHKDASSIVRSAAVADRRTPPVVSKLGSEQADQVRHPRPGQSSCAAATTDKKAIRAMSAEDINGFGLPGATLQLATRSLTM